MIEFLLKWIVLSAAFWGTAQLIPGVKIKSFGSSILVSAIYATLSLFIGWLLFAIFSIGTLGLGYVLAFITWWIIGAIILLLTDKLTHRFNVAGFGTALIASAVIAILNTIGHWLISAMMS